MDPRICKTVAETRSHSSGNRKLEVATPPTSVPLDRPLEHTLAKPQKDIDREINRFLHQYRPKMRELVEKASHGSSLLPLWELGPSADEKLAKHISELSIPRLSSGLPSLLLHGLGEEKDSLDRDRIARIPNIFTQTNTVLINTSGTGKTRLLLEGLCRQWGFYFVAYPDLNDIGSQDLWRVITDLDDSRADKMRGAGRDPEAIEAALKHMKEVAERRFTQLLLARFLLLGLLVQEARELQGGLQPMEHRRLWVLLQVQPHILDHYEDIFTALTELLRETSTSDLKVRMHRQCKELNRSLEVHNPATGVGEAPPIFCVLDQVQTLSGRLRKLMWEDKTTQLREIWLSWNKVLRSPQMRFVLSGTGVKLRAIKDTLTSTACEQYPYVLVHDIGAFEDDSTQAQYIRRYVPMPSDEPIWEEFLTRAWAWFRGRYVFTEALILLILQGGYQSPHRTIDEFVETFTGFRPTDGRNRADCEPRVPLSLVSNGMSRLNFQRMDPAQAYKLCDALYDQLLYGRHNLKPFGDHQQKIFVEYGFARRRLYDTVIDEPLAILAALQWVDKNTNLSMLKYLRQDTHRNTSRLLGMFVEV